MIDFDVHKHPEDVVQLLDEHHVVAVSDHSRRRQTFGDAMESYLSEVGGTQVVPIAGSAAETVELFCAQLQQQLGDAFEIQPTIPGVVEALRFYPGEPMRRIFIWHDADTMLEHDVGQFSRLVNSLFAVAAEQEHLAPGMLIVQRVLFTGNSKLGAFADDEHGPFRRWLDEEDEDLNLWEVSSCVDQPRVLMYRMDG